MADSDWQSSISTLVPPAILVSVISFMIWIRTRAESATISNEAVFFGGNDPWYHSRVIQLIVEHFPASPMFDAWSFFPYGTGRHSGFGGLFDQLIALAALILGGGTPSAHFVNIVTAYSPVIFGAITALPTFLIARRLGNRWVGIVSAALLALASGQFLSRTVLGSADHQSAEAFFGSLAILGFIFAISVVYEEKPLWADARDRNWIALRRPVFASILGGVAIASYLMMWPPGVMLVFTMGVFVVVQSIRDYLADNPTEYLSFGTVLSMTTAGVLTILYAKSFSIDQTAFSLLQPFTLFGVAIGGVVLVVLDIEISKRDVDDRFYPIAVITSVGLGLAVIAIVYPRSIHLLQGLVVRIYGFGLLTEASAGTVAEIQPARLENAWGAYGPVFYLAMVGLIILLVRVIRENRPVELLVLLWSITIISAYFTMIRFGYYLAVNVSILAGFAIWWTAEYPLSLDTIRKPDDIEVYQIIGVIILLIAVVPGNVVAVEGRAPVWETADNFGGTDMAWHNELTWVQKNTPPIPMDYSERYNPPTDRDYDYPEGAYGVMSWWDYGHWITVQGHRIPVANPFQQGPREASAYFLAQSERRGNLILEALPSLERDQEVERLSNEDLRATIANQTETESGEDVRYVIIDDLMAGGKFAAIATWTGPGYNAYLSRQEFQIGEQTANLVGVNDRYHNTILARLYFHDGRQLEQYRLVHESQAQSAFGSVAQQTQTGLQSTSFINRRISRQTFQLVQQRGDLVFYDARRVSRVKTFERVEGATLTGSSDLSNQTQVFATVRLQTNTGRNFTYVQQTVTNDNGKFSMTVPYATQGSIPPEEGGTDSGVTALSNYSIIVGNPIAPQLSGFVEVPEPAVYNGETIEVSLKRSNETNIDLNNSKQEHEDSQINASTTRNSTSNSLIQIFS